MLFLPPPVDVTIELLPMRLDAACERFAAATGERWLPAGALLNEIVAVRLDHAPLSETKAQLAKMLEARWDGNKLVPDVAIRRERLAKLTEMSLEKHRNSLAYLAKRLAQQSTELTAKDVAATALKQKAEEEMRKDAEARQDWSRIFRSSLSYEESPAWRAAARVAPTLPFTSERTVYSDKPTPAQKGLPLTLRPIFDQYRRELTLTGKPADFSRIRILLEPWGEGSGTTLSLTALGPDNKTIDTVSIRMNGDSELMNTGGYKLPVIPPGKELPMSEETKSYFAFVNDDHKDTSNRNKAALRSQWAEKLSHPVENEPLVWQRGEAYVRTAAAAGKQMIAWMSDFQNLRYDQASPWVPARFMPPIDGMVEVEKDWMLVGRLRSVEGRVDRAAAGRMLQDSLKQGGLTVDAASAFAVGVTAKDDPFLNWVGDAVISLFSGTGGYSALGTTINGNGLRLWGGMTVLQRDALRKGRTVRIAELPALSREEIRKAVYEASVLEGEPTDLLPNGLEDGNVTLKVDEKPLTIGWNDAKGESDKPLPMPAESFGKGLALGVPYFEIPATEIRSWNRFRMGIHRRFLLNIQFDSGPSYEDSVNETLFPPGNKTVAQLPAAFISAAEKARAEARPAPKKTGGTTAP
ncbi:hypothetical protein EON81_17255 [bacterium]|nr:MAG: hypothetical protein EON81_17255 [bacterium]